MKHLFFLVPITAVNQCIRYTTGKCLFILAFTLLNYSLYAEKQEPSMDSILTGKYTPVPIPEFRPMSDARYYTCVDESNKKLIRCSYATGKQEEVILDVEKTKGNTLKQIAGYAFSPNETRLLVWADTYPVHRHSFATEYYVYDRKRNTLEPLSENGHQRDAAFSPDGRSIAFSRNNNLYIKRLEFGSEIAVTTDGVENILINGTTDRIYEEAFGETAAFDWSPDSKQLAYLKFNEKNVPDYTFPLYGKAAKNPFYAGTATIKYVAAGETNPTVTLHLFTLQNRSSKPVVLPVEPDSYLPVIRYTRNSNQLAVMTLNRNQNEFRMYFTNPKSGLSSLIINEKNDHYVEPAYNAVHFYTKGFIYLSEKDGYRHLYLYGPNGGLQKQLTSGKWDVTKYVGCDTINQVFYYQSTEDGSEKRSIYSMDRKGRKTKLSLKPGMNEATFNSDFSCFVQTWSDIKTPPKVSVCNKQGEELRIVENNKALKARLEGLKYGEKIFISVPTTDGLKLNGWMLKPTHFDKNKKYPVVQMVCTNLGEQTALDAFHFGWEYLLAEKGCIVVCVDGRGTDGRGGMFRQSLWCNIGKTDVEDQLAVAGYLKNQSYIDPVRLKIVGWNYGGFIALMTQTSKTSAFESCIAVEPICDWRYVSAAFAERYLRMPKENPTGYDVASPIQRANSQEGHLLLVYGMTDKDIHSNQGMDMAEALIQAGKPFETQIYPSGGIQQLNDAAQLHLYNRLIDFILQNQ